jgi:hypothetical protein
MLDSAMVPPLWELRFGMLIAVPWKIIEVDATTVPPEA